MGSCVSSPAPQLRRFAAYTEGLANAAGHADRHTPVTNYCKGLLLPKSVEPMAARLAPDHVRKMHQSLHHLVADAPWNDEEMLAQVRHELASILARERGGCSDELCLCNHEQLTQVESRRPASVPAPA